MNRKRVWPTRLELRVQRLTSGGGVGRAVAVLGCFAIAIGGAIRGTWYHWIVFAFMGVMLMFPGKSDSEKRGYDF